MDIDQLLISPPPRSHLYYLNPIGIGTAQVESLTSYITRLAYEHCIAVRDLVVHELLPNFGRGYLLSQENNNRSAFWKDSSMVNNLNPSTREWVHLMENMTLRLNLDFLTMLPWSNVLSSRNMLRATRTWCPKCYYERRKNNLSVYDPLLWSLKVVPLCISHRFPLEDRCRKCGREACFLAPHNYPGHCPHCQHWLGEVSEYRSTILFESDEYRWQSWLGEMVGAMLAAAPTIAVTVLKKERFAEAVEKCLDQADQNVSALSRKLRVSRRTVREWVKGTQIPQLHLLLQFCFLTDISPLQLFGVQQKFPDTVVLAFPDSDLKIQKHYRPFPFERIRLALEAESSNQTDPPRPMSAVARSLHYDQTFLYNHFPDLC